MLKRNLVMIAMLLVLGAVLAACGGRDDETYPAVVPLIYLDYEPTPAPSDYLPQDNNNENNFSRGFWVGNTYTNEYLGFTFEAPANWQVHTDAEIAQMLGMSSDFLNVDDLNDVDVMLIDMLVVCQETGTNVQVAFERLPEADRTAIEYMELASEILDTIGAIATIAPDTTTIGGYEWHSLATEMDMGFDMIAYDHQFVNISDGFARLIIISHFQSNSTVVEDVLAKISNLQ
ncbi:MAG: hypothetical protein FWC69_01840 [Defluviitaleaceae bacterium]|nr:hypothetical protein [Defluviitaleaceae bacterium]